MKNYNYTFLLSISLVAALGGLLFGYDWVVIGGAKPFYEIYFGISNSPALQGWAMSSALVGCVAGAAVAGKLADTYGRRPMLIVAAILFSLSALGTGASETFTVFIIWRIIGGIGIGIASTISPLYIAEIAPQETRGLFVSINQLTVVIGILAAQITNMLITEVIPAGYTHVEILASWNGQTGWRWMFWAGFFPAVLFFILMFLIPESPRYLAKKGNYDTAENTLTKIGGLAYAKEATVKIKETFTDESEKTDFRMLLDKKALPILTIGIVLAAFQQWCGINIIFNYAQEIFVSAGYSINDLFMNIVITGSINLVFTLVAMGTVDKIGRKKLMLFGSGALAVIYALLGYFYYTNVTGFPLLLLVLLAIAIYAMSLAPITWVILSEIFPNRIRGVAMSVATFALWIASALLVQTFPIFNEYLGTSGTFWIYGVICALGFLFVFKKLPETKNKSLEEIEELMVSDKKSKNIQ
ncbi:D-xylose-proton symporter [Flavobacterium bizetiae]|uniref:D-xylose-proton symporter n=1 Tax=Flavobacterium bizetiae TaxID=2704140 RepID=A0A6J4GDM5_9FLAO|nr:sugar porter family MFS transporter [Flavobacterium bizetiae]UTN02586.1 sugar porter family MFS transporter [Flavobacterium bizetiae]CAA9196097.1 D-xylose-proton symporter [Flavobacterium bizetiae]CAD5340541.1 D-xylose-proton symporter [Flavobacterium bizetiae]CAD5346787.1 D-xylose-proton symporter [Flavobacterium bizetiae]